MSYQRCCIDKEKLKKLLIETQNRYGKGAYFDEDKQRIVRHYISKRGYTRRIKRFYNRKIRKLDDCCCHNLYKRIAKY